MMITIRGLMVGLARLPRPWAILLALMMVAVVGVFDYVTGFDLHVDAFYLVPVCWATWAVGRMAGLLLAGLCAYVFACVGVITSNSDIPLWIDLWNAVLLLVMFVGVVYTMTAALGAYDSLAEAQASLRDANEHLEEMVRFRTSALRSEIAETRDTNKPGCRRSACWKGTRSSQHSEP